MKAVGPCCFFRSSSFRISVKVSDALQLKITTFMRQEFCIVLGNLNRFAVYLELVFSDVLHAPLQSLWRPEYATYMVEGTPGQPYGSFLNCFNQVENNMRRRRLEVNRYLKENESVLSFTSFPRWVSLSRFLSCGFSGSRFMVGRLGCPNFVFPSATTDPINGVSRSLFFPDDAIFPGHPRFRYIQTGLYRFHKAPYCCRTLTRNIRTRRGKKVAINVPRKY